MTRLGSAALIALLAMAGCGANATETVGPEAESTTSTSDVATTVLADHSVRLDELAEPLDLARPPAGAELVDSYIQEECYAYGFDRDPPEVWFDYELEDDEAKEAAIEDLQGRFTEAGWERAEGFSGLGFNVGPEAEEAHAVIGTRGSRVDVNVYLDASWSCPP